MKRYLFLILFVGSCFFVYAQRQELVTVAEAVRKDASSVRKIVWKGNQYLLKDNGIYRLPYRVLYQRTEAPLRGEIVQREGDFFVKGVGLFHDVVCFAKGVVVSANEERIVVDHGNGFESVYGNILSPSVQVGSKVKKGQLIGRLSQERELLFGLSLNGKPISVDEVFDPKTGLGTYAGDLYIYTLQNSLYVSRKAPMEQFALTKQQIDSEFISLYKKSVAEHRAKRDAVDDVLMDAQQDEIKLEDVQIGPAKKQDTIRVQNTIVL